jgi:hypothetical protein
MRFTQLSTDMVLCRTANNAAEVWAANNEALKCGKSKQDAIGYWLVDKIALGDKLSSRWEVRLVRGKSGIGDDASISLDTVKVKAFLEQAIVDGYLSLEGREELNKRSSRKGSISIYTKNMW